MSTDGIGYTTDVTMLARQQQLGPNWSIDDRVPGRLHHEDCSPYPVPVAYHVTNSTVLDRATPWPSETDSSPSPSLQLARFVGVATECVMSR